MLELMVSTAIFMLLVVVLASISNQALKTWSQNENKSDLREKARNALDLMGRELRQATLPVDRSDLLSLQFVVNPSISSTVKNRDAIFWQAPIATSRSKGDLAVVGYFVRRGAGEVGTLCRLFINPDDSDYAPSAGVTDALLNSEAPADEPNNFKGLFLENVPGMWVTAYSDATTPYAADYNSRVEQKFPKRVEITLALMDKKGALLVTAGAATLPSTTSSSTAAAYIDTLEDSLRPHVEAVTINVEF